MAIGSVVWMLGATATLRGWLRLDPLDLLLLLAFCVLTPLATGLVAIRQECGGKGTRLA